MDVRSIADPAYTAGDFSRDFFSLLPELPAPVLVAGGTGFYIDAVVRGLAKNPRPSAEIRERLAAMEIADPGSLYARLSSLDPAAARKIGTANRQRLIRAIEVCEITGGRFSEQPRVPTAFRPLIFILEMSRADLYARINARSRRMFESGLLEEVDSLLARFPRILPAFASIGYAEAVRCLSGEFTREEAIDQTALRTRRLVKRQLTWWRHFRYDHAVSVPAGIAADEVLGKWKECKPCAVLS